MTATEEWEALRKEMLRESLRRAMQYLNVSLVALNVGIAAQAVELVWEGLVEFERDCERIARMAERL